MKLTSVLVRDKHPAVAKSMYSTASGDDCRFEAGLVHIVCKGRHIITPVSNVTWMEPEEPAKTAKK